MVPVVLGVSLRNRRAAAAWLHARRARQPELRVAVVAAGERWPDGTLRPSVEDQWGAGGLVDLLRTSGWTGLSPEAHAAADTFRAVGATVAAALTRCASGLELIAGGYLDDVETAGHLDTSQAVPILREGAFRPALANTLDWSP